MKYMASCETWHGAVLTAAIVLGSFCGACSLQTHQQKREAAETRWEQVRARVKFQLARQQHKNGQTDAALASVTEAIALDPSSSAQFLLLAHCLLEQGKQASARQAVDRAAPLAPNSAEVAYAYGLIAEAENHPEAALDYHRKARELESAVMDYLVAEAECLVALARYDEAAALVSGHLGQFDSSSGTLEVLLAQIASLVGDRERALSYLREAARAAGENDAIIEEYGRLLSESGRHDEAIAVLRPYVSKRGKEAPVSISLALAGSLLAGDEAIEAKPLLQQLVRQRPDDVRGWTLLARAALAMEDWPSGRRCANEVERLDPESSLPYLVRGFVCWKQDDLIGARASLERALAINDDDSLAHDLMGRVLEKLGESAVPHVEDLSAAPRPSPPRS